MAEGAAVAVAHEPTPPMAALAGRLVERLVAEGGRAISLPADLAIPADAAGLADAARTALGPVDVLVCNAAASAPAPWCEIGLEQWDHTMAVNLRAPWLLVKAAREDLIRGRGSVITVSSVMVDTGQPGQLDYTASKAGLVGLTRALARELGPDGVRVNCVVPGAIRTEHEVEREPDADAVARAVLPLQALPRRGLSDDVAGTFVYLASEESAFVTGQALRVDGGWVVA